MSAGSFRNFRGRDVEKFRAGEAGQSKSVLEKIRKAVKECPYRTIEVVGRGTLYVDVDEVLSSEKLRAQRRKLREILLDSLD